MDAPCQYEELDRPTQLRLALFSLWALYYITRNVRKHREEVKLRTWVRLVIVTLVGIVMLSFDARPPSRAYSVRQYVFESVGMIVLLALEPALWQSAFANVKGIAERFLYIAYRRLSLFVENDLEPCFNNRIRPFVNGYITPAVDILAEHICRDFQNIAQWTGSTNSLNSFLVTLERTALYGSGVAVTGWIYVRMAEVGRLWTCVLLVLVMSVLILGLRLLFKQIWRGVARVYAVVIEFKSLVARVCVWVWCIAIVGVVIGVPWRIVVVKGEQHFGHIDDL